MKKNIVRSIVLGAVMSFITVGFMFFLIKNCGAVCVKCLIDTLNQSPSTLCYLFIYFLVTFSCIILGYSLIVTEVDNRSKKSNKKSKSKAKSKK